MFGHLLKRIRVGLEHAIHFADVSGTDTGGKEMRIPVVAKSSAKASIVSDIAGALFEIRHQSASLEHLGQDIRCLLTRKVHSSELRNGVIAVFNKYLFVEFLGSRQAHRRVN